jgi:type I restriction enzyme, S subunit
MTSVADNRLPYASSLPGSWRAVPLKYLATLANGYAFKPADWAGAGTPILRIENLNGSISFNHSTLVLGKRYQVNPGDLLYSWSGNPGTSFGPFRWVTPGTYYLNQHIFKVGVHGCDTDWLYWSLKAATHWIERELTSGMIGMVHVTKEELGGVPIPIPSVPEQRRIAAFLDAETARLDAIRSARRRQLDLLNEKVLAAWSMAIENDVRRYPSTPIRRLITAITDGPFGSSLMSSHYSESGARVIRLGNIGRAEFRAHDVAYIPLSYFAQLRRHEAEPGDLIVAGLGDQNHPLGRACVLPSDIGPAIVKADCFRLRLNKSRILHEYAALALSSPPISEQIVLLARGSTRARINLEVVREIRLPLPSLERQQKTISKLGEIRSYAQDISRRCARQLELLSERRQALITAAVTGQFDVHTASGRGVAE